MKYLVIPALLATAALAKDYDALYREFKSIHRQNVVLTAAEDKARFQNFVANMRKSEILQSANPLAEFGISPFADMSPAEFSTRLNGNKQFKEAKKLPRNEIKTTVAQRRAAAGVRVDWREKGVVTPVKDQGSCGSCWAFSVTGNIESQYAIAGNNLTRVSEQELVACDYVPGSNEGCNGGWMNTAMQWLIDNRNGEIVTEESYPYASRGGFLPQVRLQPRLTPRRR